MVLGITLRYEEFNERKLFIINSKFKEIFDKYNVTLVPLINDFVDVKLLDLCDGLILTGSGIHVNNELYGRENEINFKRIYDGEDKLDYNLINYFHNKNKPILGICRGLQVLNVYFGGTLIQKIDNHLNNDHDITIYDNTFLKDVYRSNKMLVNSTHTQAIDDLANNFKVCAVSNDNIIEAIEDKNIFGVQWHPEKLDDYKLFEYFLKRTRD